MPFYPPLDITNKIALITGGTSGIGRAIALGFAQAGAKVVAGSTNPDKVAAIKKELDVMARLKMNQYYLYNELTIALDGLPPAAPGARMSKADVRELVR